MRTELLDGLPLVGFGPNIGRLDRVAASAILGLTREQLSKAYNNWIQVFRKTESTLTFKQYLAKLEAADLSPDDVGMGNNQYQLARYGDRGCYTDENCRFITKQENRAEQAANYKRKRALSVKPSGSAPNF